MYAVATLLFGNAVLNVNIFQKLFKSVTCSMLMCYKRVYFAL